MASGRFKDLSRALHSTFANAIVSRALPDELQQTIQAYLEKHDKNEESDATRLQEELLEVHAKYVAKDDSKLAQFLQVLRLLKNAITGQARKAQWWNTVVQPILNGVGHRRDEVEYAGEFLLSILEYDADEDKDGDLAKESSRLAKLLLNAYIKRNKHRDTEDELPTQEDEYVAEQLEHVLVEYGRKKPKDLMSALAGLVHDHKHRTHALGLLCAFVRHQPPHLYTISDTPLLEYLLKCLLIDTSATSVQLALTSLIMFMPHIPTAVASNLPRLFLIYSRLLCWDRLFLAARPLEPQLGGENGDTEFKPSSPPPPSLDPTWQRMGPSPEAAETLVPNLTYYFTFLYGLYPINFMDYIRTPKEHLKDAGFANAEDYDLVHTIISQRTEQFQRTHVLHRNFLTMTKQDELNSDRWLKSDPADVVAECIGMRLEGNLQLKDPGPPPSTKLPEIPGAEVKTEDIPPQSLLNRDDDVSSGASPHVGRGVSGPIVEPFTLSRKNSNRSTRTPASQSSAFSSPRLKSRAVDDSPTLPPAFTTIGRAIAHHHNGSNASFHSGEDAANSEGELSTTVKQSHFHHSPAIRPVPPPDANSAYLQREVLLLRNDLNFERYLKQQHLSHIGHLQRRHIRDATREAEHQNLMQSNKTIRAKLAKANDSYLALKKETANDRAKSRMQESTLSLAVRSLREAEQRWRAEEENLRLDLRKANRDSDHLRQLVVESESKDLLSQQKVAQMEIELETVSTLRERVLELEKRVHEFEAQELEFVQAKDERDILRTEVAAITLQLQSRDNGQDWAKRSYDRRIADLEKKLLEAQNPQPGNMGQMNPGIQRLIDKAVFATNGKLLELRKEHAALKLKHAELELRCQQLEQELTDRGAGTLPKRPLRPDSSTGDGLYNLRPQYSGSAPTSSSIYAAQMAAQTFRLQSNSLQEQPNASATTMSTSAPAAVKHMPTRPNTASDSRGEGSIRSTGHNSRNSRSSLEGTDGSTSRSFYKNSQSAFSQDSLNDDSEKSGKGKGAAGSGSGSTESRLFGRGIGSSSTSSSSKSKEKEAEARKEWRTKSSKKVGSLRGIRGII